jgi:hypothetical protein
MLWFTMHTSSGDSSAISPFSANCCNYCRTKVTKVDTFYKLSIMGTTLNDVSLLLKAFLLPVELAGRLQ